MALSKLEATGLLKKHVNTVHCSNNATLLQRKASNVLLENAYFDLLEKDEFFIDVKSLCIGMGFNSKNTYKLKAALKGLASTVVEWGVLDKDTKEEDIRWGAGTVLAAVEIKGGVCRYEYSNTMKKFLYHPDIYAQINLKIQSQFKSSYGLALYENCARYRNIKQTPWLQLAEIKKILEAFGKVYDHYGSFKKRVLDMAVNEVNDKADFNVNLIVKKEGRAVSAVKFEILENKDITPINEVVGIIESKDKDLVVKSQLINDFKVSVSIAEKLIMVHGSDYIEDKIKLFKSLDSYNSGQIKNIAGALVDRIKNSDKYIDVVASKNHINDKYKEKVDKDKKEREKKLEKDRLNKEYSKYVEGKVSERLELLSEEDVRSLDNDFIHHCDRNNHKLVSSKFINGDRISPMVKAIYNRFVVDNFLQGRVMSKKEFIKNG